MVDVEGGTIGTVVFNTVANEWSAEFSEADWPKERYDGLMIRQENGALVFFEDHWFTSGDVPIKYADRQE